ncbi:MAG: ECF transporter S component [Clostridia bacterium]|nr:ECF transporter S component [Clostridia bacterium]
MSTVREKTLRLVQLGLLSSLIILLQLYFVIPLPGSLTLSLVLVPIVVGAVLYGPRAGALLGGVFGVLVAVMAMQGRLGALTNMMVAYNALLTVVICVLKGVAAGWVPGLIAKAFKKRSFVGVVLAAAAAPIANTGIFVIGMLTVFRGVMMDFADNIGMGGTSAVYFAVVVLVGVNFIIEFAANLILSPAVSSIVKAVRKQH